MFTLCLAAAKQTRFFHQLQLYTFLCYELSPEDRETIVERLLTRNAKEVPSVWVLLVLAEKYQPEREKFLQKAIETEVSKSAQKALCQAYIHNDWVFTRTEFDCLLPDPLSLNFEWEKLAYQALSNNSHLFTNIEQNHLAKYRKRLEYRLEHPSIHQRIALWVSAITD